MNRLDWTGVALAAFLALLSCEDNNLISQSGLPNDVRQAAGILLDSLQIDSTAEVFVVGPLPAGTILREFLPDATDTTASTLEIPIRNEAKYGFFINDHKDLNWSHGVRFAWVGVTSREVEFVTADWPMFVDHPAGFEDPFDQTADETIDGVKFRFGTGGGSLHEDTDVNKPADTLRVPIAPRSLDAPCKKIGYLFDGGEWSDFWGKQGFSAGAMADNAGLVETFYRTMVSRRRATANTRATTFLHSSSREHRRSTAEQDSEALLRSSNVLAKAIRPATSSSCIFVVTETTTSCRCMSRAIQIGPTSRIRT